MRGSAAQYLNQALELDSLGFSTCTATHLLCKLGKV